MLNHEQMPGAGSVADTIDFMKKMWSSMGAPAMAPPAMTSPLWRSSLPVGQ